MSNPPQIGMFGGTFDPVHNTHLAIARRAVAEAHLDRLFFIVAARPPHKVAETYATPQQRMAMVRAAIVGEEKMEASAIEIDREGPSYTVETLDELGRLHPGASLTLIVGVDSLAEILTWKDPKGILARARLLAVPRPGQELLVPPELEGAYDLLSFEESSVSSTEVRSRVAARESIGDLVPEGVEGFIRKEGIYRGRIAQSS